MRTQEAWCCGRRGAILREGVSLTSSYLFDIESGTLVLLEDELREPKTGVLRWRVRVGASSGWVSAKLFESAWQTDDSDERALEEITAVDALTPPPYAAARHTWLEAAADVAALLAEMRDSSGSVEAWSAGIRSALTPRSAESKSPFAGAHSPDFGELVRKLIGDAAETHRPRHSKAIESNGGTEASALSSLLSSISAESERVWFGSVGCAPSTPDSQCWMEQALVAPPRERYTFNRKAVPAVPPPPDAPGPSPSPSPPSPPPPVDERTAAWRRAWPQRPELLPAWVRAVAMPLALCAYKPQCACSRRKIEPNRISRSARSLHQG